MILEIRTYRLHPGSRDEFVRLMEEDSLPLLMDHGISVVDYGSSLADEDGVEEAYLIRSFPSLEERERQEAGFYGSEEWRTGPRDDVLTLIDIYHTIVFEATEEAVRELQRGATHR